MVEVNSMLSLENCHVRVNKKSLVIEADGHTQFTTMEKFGSTVFPPEQLQ
jgi:hypothetical protein